jgi:hypothetical protein
MELASISTAVGWVLLHIGALVLALGTRIAIGSRVEAAMQLGFFLAMAALGVTAWVCRHLEMSLWMISAVTLMVMVLTAVTDFRRHSEPVFATARHTDS